MALVQVSNKSEITLRGNLDHALSHGEADQNFKQLQNVIEDVTALIKAISKIDDLNTIIDNSLSGPLKNFEDQIQQMTTRVQSTIDSLNKSSEIITETKEIANTSHNQIVKAANVLFKDTEYAENDPNATDTLINIIKVGNAKYGANIAHAHNTTYGTVFIKDAHYQRVNGGAGFSRLENITESNYKENPIYQYIEDFDKIKSAFTNPGWYTDKWGDSPTVTPSAIAQYVEYNYIRRSEVAELEKRLAALEAKVNGG